MTFKKKKKKKVFQDSEYSQTAAGECLTIGGGAFTGKRVCVWGGAVNYFLTLLVEDFSFSNRSNSSDCNYNCVSKRHTGLAVVSPGSKLLCFLLLLLLSFIVR